MNKDILKGVEVFGVSGKISTGKNYIAEKVLTKMLDPQPTMITSFADQIKVNGIVQHGLDRYKCFVEKDEHTRKTMQRVGTEEGRNVYGQDIWTRYTLEWMIVHASRGIKRFIIPDVRFHNEFDFIKDLGGTVIRVDAPKRNMAGLEKEAARGVGTVESIGLHISETELDQGRTFDYVINNDIDAPNVYIQIRNMIRDIKKKNKKDVVMFCDLDNTVCECNEYYIVQAEKVKSMIEKNLRYDIPIEVFEEMFSTSVKRHNGKYAHSYFQIDRFAESQTWVVDDFAKHIRPDVDINSLRAQAFQWGMDVFDYSYVPIKDRVQQLRDLSKFGKVVLFTMGDRLEQAKKIAELQLMDFDFEVYDFKDATIFRHLQEKYPAKVHCMIGDSLHRDILPSIEAGIPIVVRVSDKKESYWGDDNNNQKNYHQVNDLKEADNVIRERVYEINRAALKKSMEPA